ncbi:MAG: winged helix-turn-helix domain-containing protein [Betaproteobacteria bacterium]
MDTPIGTAELIASTLSAPLGGRTPNSDECQRPRLTLLAGVQHDAAVGKLGEFNAFNITRLAPNSNARCINNTDPMVISILAENDADLVGLCKNLLMSDLAAPLVVITPELDTFREAFLLEMGARDVIMLNRGSYVAAARIRAIAQGASERGRNDKVTRLQFGRLEIDSGARSAKFSGSDIKLTTAEFDTLWILAKNAGRTVSRLELQPPNAKNELNPTPSRFIDYRINRLRKRLLVATRQQKRICTIRATGYMFSTADW